MNLVGLDACRFGWCTVGVVENNRVYGCFKNLTALLQAHPKLNRILIDIPIGLSSKHFERSLDAKARTYLNKRKSSIFSPPSREALYADNYQQALAINKDIEGKGLSIQSYNIGTKIKEVDEWFNTKPKQLQVYEAHPELCFKSLNQNQDLEFSKHDKAGIKERQNLLFSLDKNLEALYTNLLKNYKRNQVKPDDILDAMALFLVNNTSEQLKLIADENSIDETGKTVCIVYG